MYIDANKDSLCYAIFLDNLYVDYCVIADDINNYVTVYDATENKYLGGVLFKEAYAPTIYRTIRGNVDIIKVELVTQ